MIKHTDKLLVVDLECTCWQGGVEPEGEKSEIIQIGWAWLALDTLLVSDKGSLFIKPQMSRLSDYCTALTGITYKQIKGGIPFEHACKWLVKNLGCKSRHWAAWGGDKNTFEAQCALLKCESPFNDGYINIQQLMSIFGNFDTPRPGLEKVMAQLGIQPCGLAHRADNDAYDTAAVLAHMIGMYRKCTVPVPSAHGPQSGSTDETPTIAP